MQVDRGLAFYMYANLRNVKVWTILKIEYILQTASGLSVSSGQKSQWLIFFFFLEHTIKLMMTMTQQS